MVMVLYVFQFIINWFRDIEADVETAQDLHAYYEEFETYTEKLDDVINGVSLQIETTIDRHFVLVSSSCMSMNFSNSFRLHCHH